MPTYDYVCPANDQVVEVQHRMAESVETWGELCALSGGDIGATPANSPVRKKLSAVAVSTPKVGEWRKRPAKKSSPNNHSHRSGCGCGC